MKHFINTLLIFLISLPAFSQIKNIGSIPFINYYSTDSYNAARQNWAVVQDKRGLMYFGNSDGSVLEFDGQNWNRIKIAETSIRSLCVDNQNKIFVGGKNIFGFLMPGKNGKLVFHSLKHLIPEKHQNFQDVWDIFITKDSNVFFHTFDEIFIYNYDSIKVMSIDDYFPKGLFLMSFKVNNDILIYTKYKGIYKLNKNELNYIKDSEKIDSSMVRAVLPYNNKKDYLVFTWFDGAFKYNGKKFTKIKTPIDSVIYHNTYRVANIKNDYFAFLLYNGGLLITDKNFKIIQFLTMTQDLVNDRIYKTYIDYQDNLWLCTNNGITSIYLFSPFSTFQRKYGFDDKSTCFSALKIKNKLYVGTNSGVFYKSWDKYENKIHNEKFKLIPNNLGNYNTHQIKLINNSILTSSEGGFFKIENLKFKNILENRAVKTFTLTNDDKNTIIGLKAAIFIFKKINNEWTLFKDIQGYMGEYLVQDNDKYFWISDLITGVTKIKFDENYSEITETERYNADNESLNGLPTEKNVKIFKLKDTILFVTSKGVFIYNKKENIFEPYNFIHKKLGKKVNLSFIKEDSHGNIWFKEQIDTNNQKNWELGLLKNTDSGYVLIDKPFLFLKNKIFSFNQITDKTYIIGGPSGFVHYDAKIPFNQNTDFPVFIRSVKISGIDSTIFSGTFITEDSLIGFNQSQKQIHILPYKYGNLRFSFAGAFYENPDKIKYKYFLEGNDDTWSDWTSENYKDYSNLKPGEYIFKVKAKNYYQTETSIVSYKFTIKPPFYLTVVAFIIYFIIAGLLIWLILYLYTRRLRKQKEALERQVQLRTKEIAQQKQEIEAQRDQLANQNKKIQKINKDLTDSIEYAKRIQTAMLPLEQNIRKYLPEYFILFKPRDIVSGDFYWFSHTNNKTFITAVDCTGHGVPGAFMSMIGAEILTTIINNKEVDDPAKILELQNKYIRTALKQDTTDNQDGMDMALCVIDKENKKLEFAGAKNPLFYIHNNKLTKIRGNKQSIGGFQFDTFKKHVIEYKSPTWFYIFSDGYPDQFGGEDFSKFMIKKFKELLIEIHKKDFDEQKQILDKKIIQWMKNNRQTDDILVIGFKI